MSAMSTKLRTILPAVFLVLLLYSVAEGQTRQYLDAPVVKSNIRVRWNPSTKEMEWAADGGGTFRGLQSDTLFLTKRSVFVTYALLNPLRVQASASATAVADPSFATITKLIESLMGVANIVAPGLPNPATPAGALAPSSVAITCNDATSDLSLLRAHLYGPSTTPVAVGKSMTAWVNTIDTALKGGMNGPTSIASGVHVIRGSADSYGTIAKAAQDDWTKVLDCANTAPPNQRGFYAAAALTDQTIRIQQLLALKAATAQLADLLDQQYGAAAKWTGTNLTDFVISPEIAPTFSQMQNVAVKVASVTLKVDSATSMISTDQQVAGSTTFSVRRYSALTPEIGVGAVFGTIQQPTYGTGKDASGQTIVARAPTKSLSVNPTILVNFVCRCGSGILVPMAQIGTSTSKTLPAILLGGGVRLFGLGKGDVAIGGGAMFAWYQDLQKLKVGDVITGTNDINADLGYISTPKVGGYFALQYKF